MKEIIKPIPFDMGMDVSKIKGHVRIELTDPKTGEVEVRESDNMMTNAMAEYFQNCGFLNFPNIDLNNMVIDLLGGVMAFDQPIDDDPTIVHVPAGCKMTCNGSVGEVNSSVSPSELGSWVNDPEVSGWIANNIYQQTYSYLEQQGNGTISTVCLTGKNYGYVGEGNWRSNVAHPTKASFMNLEGSATSYSGIPGQVFGWDFTNSTVCSFSIENVVVEEQTVTKGFVRKYRLPIGKLDLNSTRSAPILLSETEVTLDDDIKNYSKRYQPLGDNLVIWNIHVYGPPTNPPEWGVNWDQYVWTVTPTGTITKQEYYNTSGTTLYGLQGAIFDGDYIFFIKGTGGGSSNYYNGRADSRIIYILNRTTGVITSVTNPTGVESGSTYPSWENQLSYCGWVLRRGTGDGRIVTMGYRSFMVDAVLALATPTNADNTNAGTRANTPKPLIKSNGTNLLRDQTYIASIFEVDPPIVKDATRTMKIIYTITFPTGGESNA